MKLACIMVGGAVLLWAMPSSLHLVAVWAFAIVHGVYGAILARPGSPADIALHFVIF